MALRILRCRALFRSVYFSNRFATAHQSPTSHEYTGNICSSSELVSRRLSSAPKDPLSAYNSKINGGIFVPDENQLEVVSKLQAVHHQLLNYTPSPLPDLDSHSTEAALEGDSKETEVEKGGVAPPPPPPHGLYIYGEVGCGKTAMLDLFYDTVPVSKKRRTHFHSFMLDIYSRLHRESLKVDTDSISSPLCAVAREIAQDSWLLCFDELQLADYGSTSILAGLFQSLFDHGAVVVATSNRPLSELGASGITDEQKENSSALGQLLSQHCHVAHLGTLRDYRLEQWQDPPKYFYPLGSVSNRKLAAAFRSLVKGKPLITDAYVKVYGRKVSIPLATECGIARFGFEELCCSLRGPADYIAICNKYHTIFVDGVPRLSLNQKNEARRFITFIDAVYESKVKLYCSAGARPEKLFSLIPEVTSATQDIMQREMMGELTFDMRLEQTYDSLRLAMLTGMDEIFAFRRAVSRLNEIQSFAYSLLPHTPQFFSPYIGTEDDHMSFDTARRARLARNILEERERLERGGGTQRQEGDQNPGVVNFPQPSSDDWGYEASWEAWANDLNRRRLAQQETGIETLNADEKPKRGPPPTFSELHFFGFGWWEKVLGKKPRKKS